jgi:hypothetical protein
MSDFDDFIGERFPRFPEPSPRRSGSDRSDRRRDTSERRPDPPDPRYKVFTPDEIRNAFEKALSKYRTEK